MTDFESAVLKALLGIMDQNMAIIILLKKPYNEIPPVTRYVDAANETHRAVSDFLNQQPAPVR